MRLPMQALSFDGKPIYDATLTLRSAFSGDEMSSDAGSRCPASAPDRGGMSMADSTQEVWITGIGIVSCLGKCPDAHWQKLMQEHPDTDTTTFAPLLCIRYFQSISMPKSQKRATS